MFDAGSQADNKMDFSIRRNWLRLVIVAAIVTLLVITIRSQVQTTLPAKRASSQTRVWFVV